MEKIITCIDGSTTTSSVTDAGVWAANKLNKTLFFLHTLEKTQQHGADNYTGAIGLGARSSLLAEITKLDEKRNKVALKLGEQLLESAVSSAQAKGISNTETLQRHGDIVDTIMTLEHDARLIITGRRGKEHKDDFTALGSHIETLLRKTNVSVLIVPDTFIAPTSFMIAYDGRESADRALQRVIDGGLLQDLDCHLVSVNNKDTLLKEKFEAAANKLKNEGIKVTAAFLDGAINETLISYQVNNNIDFMVMGAFGHSKIRQFFVGSNTMDVLERAKVPLIILR